MKNINPKEKEEILFNKMNDTIMDVAKIYMFMHDKEQDFGIEDKLRRVEIHMIKAIGDNPGVNLTNLAKILGVTKPTVSEKIKKLIELDLIRKQASHMSNKEIVILLTDKGWIAYQCHEDNHKRLFNMFKEYFGDEASVFLDTFGNNLHKFYNFLNKRKFF